MHSLVHFFVVKTSMWDQENKIVKTWLFIINVFGVFRSKDQWYKCDMNWPDWQIVYCYSRINIDQFNKLFLQIAPTIYTWYLPHQWPTWWAILTIRDKSDVLISFLTILRVCLEQIFEDLRILMVELHWDLTLNIRNIYRLHWKYRKTVNKSSFQWI